MAICQVSGLILPPVLGVSMPVQHGASRKCDLLSLNARSNATRARRAVGDGQYRKALQTLTSMGLALPSSDIFSEMLAKHPCVDPLTRGCVTVHLMRSLCLQSR